MSTRTDVSAAGFASLTGLGLFSFSGTDFLVAAITASFFTGGCFFAGGFALASVSILDSVDLSLILFEL